MELGGKNPDTELVGMYLKFIGGKVIIRKSIPLGVARKFCTDNFDQLAIAEVKIHRRGRPFIVWYKSARTWNCYSAGYLNDGTPVGFIGMTFKSYKI